MERHPFARAFAERDHAGTVELLAEDVIFHSPVISDTAFEGRAATAALFEIVFRETSEIEYTHEFGDETAHILVANARVRGKRVKLTTLLELSPDGRIREIWVMARPLVGLVAIAEAIGSGLSQVVAPSSTRPLAVAVKPLAGMAGAVDGIGSRLIAGLNRSAQRRSG